MHCQSWVLWLLPTCMRLLPWFCLLGWLEHLPSPPSNSTLTTRIDSVLMWELNTWIWADVYDEWHFCVALQLLNCHWGLLHTSLYRNLNLSGNWKQQKHFLEYCLASSTSYLFVSNTFFNIVCLTRFFMKYFLKAY